MTTKTEMDLITSVPSAGFLGSVLTNALVIFSTTIFLKIVWAFINFIKWIFTEYPSLKALKKSNEILTVDVNTLKTDISAMKIVLAKIDKKLGTE